MPDRDTWDFSGDQSGAQGPTPQGDDGWGSPSDGWGSGEDDWGSAGDWGTPAPSDGADSFGQDDFPSPQGGVAPQQGGFIQPDDAGWGSTSGFDESQLTPQPDQFPSDFANSEANAQEFQPKRFNLSPKKVAVIVLVAGIIISLLFLGIDKIHFTKKPQQPTPPAQTTQQPNQNQNQGGNQTGQNQTGQNTPSVPVDSVVLVEIPESTALDYNGDVFQANGTVTSKIKYVCGNQILYCINIGVAFGQVSETVSYYGSYSSFNNVAVGDIVILKYQQVNENYISVVSVTK